MNHERLIELLTSVLGKGKSTNRGNHAFICPFYEVFSMNFIFILNMGRNKKYITPGELAIAKKEWARQYYERHKDRINKKSMDKYYELRKNLLPNNK
jgi:hypothetical protein